MSDVWITFTAAMTAEILANRKDMTRRLSVRWKVGDRLRVCEPIRRRVGGRAHYSADGAPAATLDAMPSERDMGIPWRWKPNGLPGRYMPRDLCRIDLDVLEVRREPLQAITDGDIAREGVSLASLTALLGRKPKGELSLRQMWVLGWDSINGAKPGASWLENPTVTVTTFRRLAP